MALLPIIERELRVALRKRQPARGRLRVAGFAVAGTLGFLLLATVGGDRQAGHSLHQLLCLAAGYFILKTPQLTAGVFAEERRQRTLGLLFLSGLSATEVFASKLLSAALVAFGDLLALFPMLAIPFLVGGVSFKLFFATICAVPNCFLFVLAVCLLASVLTRDDGTALILASVFLFLLCGAGPLIDFAQSQFSPGAKVWSAWHLLSPAYGPFLVWRGFGAVSQTEFWQNYAITFGWSVLCLSVAAVVLKSLWREREDEFSPIGWRGRWQRWWHGEARDRRQLAATWLEVNPFVWLAARDRQPAVLAWLVVGGIGAGWLGCWAAWPHRWLSVANFFLTAVLLNLALAWLIRYTAARSLGEARRDGAYELLLTTPLNPSDIVWGQFEALGWHFRRVARTVLGLEILMMLAGLLLRGWTHSSLLVYGLVWMMLLLWALGQAWQWRGTAYVLWISLNCARPAHAVWRATGLSFWSCFWIYFFVPLLFRKLTAFPTGSTFEIILASAYGGLFLIASLAKWVAHVGKSYKVGVNWERRLVAEFREIVREPVPDPHDPRFKKWNPRERFPWGMELVQQQLHERLARRQSGGIR